MKSLDEDSGFVCEQCLVLLDIEVPATTLVDSLVDRNQQIPMCEECFENWCTETEFLMTDSEDDY